MNTRGCQKVIAIALAAKIDHESEEAIGSHQDLEPTLGAEALVESSTGQPFRFQVRDSTIEVIYSGYDGEVDKIRESISGFFNDDRKIRIRLR